MYRNCRMIWKPTSLDNLRFIGMFPELQCIMNQLEILLNCIADSSLHCLEKRDWDSTFLASFYVMLALILPVNGPHFKCEGRRLWMQLQGIQLGNSSIKGKVLVFYLCSHFLFSTWNRICTHALCMQSIIKDHGTH